MYLINPEILTRFRNHDTEWIDGWKGNIGNVLTFHPWQQSLVDECVESCAALLWWGHYGAWDTNAQAKTDAFLIYGLQCDQLTSLARVAYSQHHDPTNFEAVWPFVANAVADPLMRSIAYRDAELRDTRAHIETLQAEAARCDVLAVQDFEKFWSTIIFDGNDVPTNVKNELHDYHLIMGIFAEVYCSITGGRFSKLLYDPSVIIGAFEDVADRQAKEHAAEVTEELRAEVEALKAEIDRLKLEQQSSIGFS